MHILVVDDSEDIRDITEALLTDAGYKDVSTVGSAEECFDALTLDQPNKAEPTSLDLILLDVVMPEIDGIEACARIRNDPRYTDLPIIMVTQRGDTDTLANAFIAGATDYITKPVVKIKLLARVRAALKLKSELDRRKEREAEMLKRMSGTPDGQSWNLIDDVTGLFVGEVAEAYLQSAAQFADDDTSVIALAIDRMSAYRAAHGDAVAERVMSQVARCVRATAATVGVVAAAYRNGVIVLVVPEFRAKPAKDLGDQLRKTIAELAIDNAEAIAADHITASVAVITGRVDRWSDLTNLLTRAMGVVREIEALGGDRVAAASA